uniref:Chondroitin proteoglycan 4 domain-containing protein n=1 Tax=Parascaris univalens TaxID=6257 RepID=A0A914ZIR7_PARUN
MLLISSSKTLLPIAFSMLLGLFECSMAKPTLVILSLLVLFAHASLQPPDSDINGERAKAGRADYLMFLVAAGAPKCLFPCVKDLVGAGVDAFDARNTITKTEIVCKEYQKATACVKESGCKNTEVYDIATKGIHATCVEKLPLMPMVAPCLKKHADKALLGCDKSCGFSDAVSALTTREEVRELAGKGGDIYVLMKYGGPVCNSITCFLSCAHKRLERKCPSTGTAFVDSAVRPFEAIARRLQTAPKSTIASVDKHLPAECKSLIDIHYLGRLKFFGALPDRKGEKKPSGGL